MREQVTAERVRALMAAFGENLRQETSIYLVGGVSAVLSGWRESTLDIDLKIVPDSEAYGAIADLKERMSLNIELASPHDFLPPLPGWQERSVFLERHGKVSFFHFDFYSQALSKIERGFGRDLADVRAMVERGLVKPRLALDLLETIVPDLVRYPSVDPRAFRAAAGTALGGG